MAEESFKITYKERTDYIQTVKEELISKIGKAQAILLLQKVPKSEIRVKKMNNGMSFKYIEHAFISETLNFVTGLDWDLVVTDRERIDDQAIVHGYVEVRFKNVTIKKHASGGMRFIATNRNMTWADAFNGATSRMLRAGAARMGLGLELYRHEEKQFEEISEKAPAKREIVQTDDSESASSAQIATLKGLGFDADMTNMTKGEAREKIKELTK